MTQLLGLTESTDESLNAQNESSQPTDASITDRTDSVLDSLRDIAENVQLESNFCIRHPNYKPLELPAAVADRFQQLPSSLQTKYRVLQLRSFIYGIYYNGSLHRALMAADSDQPPEQNLENNRFQGVDLEFYEQLHHNNHGSGNFDSGWQVIRQEADGTLAVRKDQLTLHIEPNRHLRPEHQSAVQGDRVAIRLPQNRVQSGFYMAVGNASEFDRHASEVAQWVRLYFNLTPTGAIAVMDALTQQLNDRAISFKFKTLYNPSDFDRFDSAVLYGDQRNYGAIRAIIQEIYLANRSHFQPDIPLFTKKLAPGLALAEEPDSKLTAKESFGTHRCQLVANGLLAAHENGDESPESRITAILQQFSRLGIDVKCPYLNANSEDVYPGLQLC